MQAGVPVVMYRANFDLNVLNKATRGSGGLPAGTTVVAGTSAAAADVPVDVWVDAEGRVRRIWFVASYDQSDTLSYRSSPGHTQTTVSISHNDIEKDLWLTHLGEPVVITVPSAIVPPKGTDTSGSGPSN